MKSKTIDIPIYRAKLTIIFDYDLSFVEKKYKTKSLKDFGAVTIKDDSKHRHYVVAFEYSDGSIIAHEIVHIINYIFLDCGIELDRVNDENQAYLTGWLFDEIDKFLNQ
jgi:hypothetical protein